MIVRYVYFLIRSDDYVNTENQKSLFIYLKNDSGGFSQVKLMGMVKVFLGVLFFSILFWGRKIWQVIFGGP